MKSKFQSSRTANISKTQITEKVHKLHQVTIYFHLNSNCPGHPCCKTNSFQRAKKRKGWKREPSCVICLAWQYVIWVYWRRIQPRYKQHAEIILANKVFTVRICEARISTCGPQELRKRQNSLISLWSFPFFSCDLPTISTKSHCFITQFITRKRASTGQDPGVAETHSPRVHSLLAWPCPMSSLQAMHPAAEWQSHPRPGSGDQGEFPPWAAQGESGTEITQQFNI